MTEETGNSLEEATSLAIQEARTQEMRPAAMGVQDLSKLSSASKESVGLSELKDPGHTHHSQSEFSK